MLSMSEAISDEPGLEIPADSNQRKLVWDQDPFSCVPYICAFFGSSRQFNAGTPSLGPISCSIRRPVIDHRLENFANRARSSVSLPLSTSSFSHVISAADKSARRVNGIGVLSSPSFRRDLSNLLEAQHDDDRWT